MANGTLTMEPDFVDPVANDRLKKSFGSWFWAALLLASAFHYAFFAYWPDMTAADVSIQSEEIEQVEVMDEFEIPPPPEQIARPAIPVISTNINISDNITISEVTFSTNPVSDLPPPPTNASVEISEQPVFTPMEIRPELRNRTEFTQALERRYPPMLKDAGIGGTVNVWVFIDERGEVQNTRVNQTSGYPQLDEVAESLMREVADFSPAINRDQNVPVWISIPVTFQTRS
jgi:protein TonB